jgi:hypothetical protein
MWYWKLYSREHGEEEFGGYDTEGKALEGQRRVRAKAKELNDGVERFYTEPYQRG